MQFPLGEEHNFEGVADLLSRKAYRYSGGAAGTEGEWPDDIAGKADPYREKLAEAVADADDTLLEKYLEQGELSTEEIVSGLKAGFAQGAGSVTPDTAGAPAGAPSDEPQSALPRERDARHSAGRPSGKRCALSTTIANSFKCGRAMTVFKYTYPFTTPSGVLVSATLRFHSYIVKPPTRGSRSFLRGDELHSGAAGDSPPRYVPRSPHHAYGAAGAIVAPAASRTRS